MQIGKRWLKGVGWVRPTHCHRGHAFNDKNTYLYRGRQYCKRCVALNQTVYRRKRASQTVSA